MGKRMETGDFMSDDELVNAIVYEAVSHRCSAGCEEVARGAIRLSARILDDPELAHGIKCLIELFRLKVNGADVDDMDSGTGIEDEFKLDVDVSEFGDEDLLDEEPIPETLRSRELEEVLSSHRLAEGIDQEDKKKVSGGEE